MIVIKIAHLFQLSHSLHATLLSPQADHNRLVLSLLAWVFRGLLN